MKQHHIAYSSVPPSHDEWVAFTARIETIQDIIATLKVSPCCGVDDALDSIEFISGELYDLLDVANENMTNDEK